MCGAMFVCMPIAGLMAPADKWPYEPLALLLRDPFTMVANELGENRIIELMSNESEYGDEDSARFRLTDARMLPGRGLFSREPSMLKWKSVLANELGGCRSVSGPRVPRYSELRPMPVCVFFFFLVSKKKKIN